MSDQNSNSFQIDLDPIDTPQGAMERVFISEVKSPSYSDYNANTVLGEMRDMRQVLENRLKNPNIYHAKGAKNEIDILKAPGQFRDFESYPNLSAEKKSKHRKN